MSNSLFLPLLLLLFFINMSHSAFATEDARYVGAKSCQDCHEKAFEVWQKTPHFESFKTRHKTDEAKQIEKAFDDHGKMKKNETCVLCHYSKIGKKVKAGPSCESCHGAASKWKDVHGDFGGKEANAKTESAEHKQERLQKSEAGGMIFSHQVYQLSANCMQCHGLSNPHLKAPELNKLLKAGHPIEADFEVLRYSQGSLRHRFSNEEKKNAELDAAGKARLYLGGQAASLVFSTRMQGKSQDEKFTAALEAKIEQAKKALTAVKETIPEVTALLEKPNEVNALAFEKALKDKDLSANVSSFMSDDYK